MGSNIIQALNKWISEKNKEEIAKVLKDILSFYTNPSLGSVSKREFEAFVVYRLIDAGILEQTPYKVARQLGISPSRAKSLLLDCSIKYKNDEDLENKLKEILKNPITEKFEQDIVMLEITDPAAYELFKEKLQAKRILADTSFNKNILRMKVDAFIDIISDYVDEEVKGRLTDELKKKGKLREKDLKTLEVKSLVKIAIEEFVRGGSYTLGTFVARYIFGDFS